MADDLMPLLIGFTIRATLVIVFAWVLTAAMRRASAAARHFVWTSALVGAALVPAIGWIAPRWEVAAPIASALPVRASVTPGDAPAEPSSSVENAAAAASRATPASEPRRPSFSYTAIAFATWSIGAAAVLLYMVVGWLSAAHLRRRAARTRALSGEALSGEDAQAIADAFRITQPIAIVASDAVTTPMVCGIWRPVIVMPPTAADWPDERRHLVLLHELAHIKRRDCLTQALAQIVCAGYWFNPLVWFAAHRLRAERERACDDFVLAAGTRGSDYAGHLLEIAQASQPARFSPMATAAVAMARRSQLEGRLMAILDPAIRRSPAFYTRFAAAALVALVAVPAAAVRLVPPVAAMVPQPETARPAPSTPRGIPATQNQPSRIVRLDENAQGPRAAGQTPPRTVTQDDAVRYSLNRTLLEFADEGDLDGAVAMLSAGADVNARIPGDGSPLIAAANEGHLEMVALLLNRGADPNLFVPGDGTALIAAAEEGHLDVVSLLLDKGADPNAIAPGDGTALIAASSEGHASVAALLLQRGAQVNLIAEGDETALIQASDEGHLNVVKLLVSGGADVNLGVWAERSDWDNRTQRVVRLGPELRTPLNRAREEGHVDIVTFLISAGARD